MSDIIDEKEKLLVEFALADRDLFIKVVRILRPEYFEKPLDRVVECILNYFNSYHSLPSIDIIKAETGILLIDRDITKDEIEYLSEELEIHCQNAAMRMAILESVDDHLPDNDFSSIFESVKNALNIKLDNNIGLEYFTDPALRLEMMQANLESHTIGWASIDKMVDMIKRGDLFLVAAGTGGGKSLFLANVANNFAKRNKNALYISLELKDELIAKRMDSIITGIEQKEIFHRIEDIESSLKQLSGSYGNLIIKKMPVGSNSNDIRTYLMDYHLAFGYYPDYLGVDYLDLMSPNAKGGSDNGVFDRDKQITEELREIMQDIDAYGFTASQLNRDAVGVVTKDHSHIAGGISKLNTVDAAISLSRTEDQIKNGEVEVQALKLRNASMTTVPIILYIDDKTLEITEKPNIKRYLNNTSVSSNMTGKNKVNLIIDNLKKKKTK